MVKNYKGGISSIGYQLGKNTKITGFGAKRNINKINFRGGAGEDEEQIIEEEQIKSRRGRPRKAIIPSAASAAPAKMEEDQDLYYNYVPKYKDNAVEMLNKALNALRLESMHIKRNVVDTVIAREETKRLKRAERYINKLLFETF